MMAQPKAFRSPDVVKFLKHLLRHIAGKPLVIWDGSPIHRSNIIKEYMASESQGRIHLERFHAYAPELSLDEGIWNYPKRVELKNVACQTIDESGHELRKAKERLRHKHDVILGCIKQV